jgi:hypothetical protein
VTDCHGCKGHWELWRRRKGAPRVLGSCRRGGGEGGATREEAERGREGEKLKFSPPSPRSRRRRRPCLLEALPAVLCPPTIIHYIIASRRPIPDQTERLQDYITSPSSLSLHPDQSLSLPADAFSSSPSDAISALSTPPMAISAIAIARALLICLSISHDSTCKYSAGISPCLSTILRAFLRQLVR